MDLKQYGVYIMASLSRTLYVGVTNDLARRTLQHRAKMVPGFTSKYNVTLLVHAEQFGDVRDAIAREKQIKGWRRDRKIELIEMNNPEWEICPMLGSRPNKILRFAQDDRSVSWRGNEHRAGWKARATASEWGSITRRYDGGWCTAAGARPSSRSSRRPMSSTCRSRR